MREIFNYLGIFLALTMTIIAFLFFIRNINTPYLQFADQANSFLNGRLDINPSNDTVIKDGKYYWHQGPFPSIIIMPLKALNLVYRGQVYMQIIALTILTFLLYRLCRLKGFSLHSSFYLIFAFFISSVMIGIITTPSSWFYSQVIAVTLLTAILLELETKKRAWVLGILEGAIIATRPTAGLIAIAVILLKIKKIKEILIFSLPILVTIIILLWFNFARFGNPFFNTYQTNEVGTTYEHLRNIGILSIEHIPSNFYYYFLSSVVPVTDNLKHLIPPFFSYDPWGLSFFLVAPFFLYSLKTFGSRDKYLNLLWVMVGLTLLLLLIYFSPGYFQFGPRYTGDFLPILFLLVLYGLSPPNLKPQEKLIIIISGAFNLYLLLGPHGY